MTAANPLAGNPLRSWRRALGLKTQAAAAHALGMSPRSYQRLEALTAEELQERHRTALLAAGYLWERQDPQARFPPSARPLPDLLA